MPTYGTAWRQTVRPSQGMARVFNGTDQYLSLAAPIVTAWPLTVMGWMKLDSPNEDCAFSMYPTTNEGGSGFNSLFLGINSGGNAMAYVQHPYRYAIGSATVAAGRWHHVCGRFAASTTVGVYLDGADYAENTAAVGNPVLAGTIQAAIGRAEQYGGAPFWYTDGALWGWMAWNADLTQAEIREVIRQQTTVGKVTVRKSNIVMDLNGDRDLVGGRVFTPVNDPTWARGPVLHQKTRRRIITLDDSDTTYVTVRRRHAIKTPVYGKRPPSLHDLDPANPIDWSDPINRSLVGYWAAFTGPGRSSWGNLARTPMPAVGGGGTATASGGEYVQAWSFDGSDDIIEVADDPSISFGDGSTDRAFSITAIINQNAVDWYFPIAAKGAAGASSGREWAFYVEYGNPAMVLYDDNGANRIGRKASSVPTAGGQNHVVTTTYDGSKSSSGIKVYCDGVQVDDTNENLGSYGGADNTASPMILGYVYSGLYAAGSIASVRIDARELTAADAARLARQPWAGLNVRRTRRTIANVVTASSTYFPYYLHTNTSFGAFGLGHTTGLIAS